MTKFDVTRHETGVVRVFAVSPAEPGDWDGDAALDPAHLERALGVTRIDTDHVELTTGEELQPIGLSVYLTEGMGLPDDQIAADRAKLDALRGPVLIVRSPAFAGVEGRISPSGELTLIGTYREPHALPDFEPLVSEAAHGPASGTEAPSSGGAAAGRGRGSSTVLLAIAAIVILLLLLVFLLG